LKKSQNPWQVFSCRALLPLVFKFDFYFVSPEKDPGILKGKIPGGIHHVFKEEKGRIGVYRQKPGFLGVGGYRFQGFYAPLDNEIVIVFHDITHLVVLKVLIRQPGEEPGRDIGNMKT
jgi:hypothetical protein